MKDPIIIAFPKGRLLGPSMALFSRIGLLPRGLHSDSRKLVFDNRKHGMRLIIVRATDVPTYVEYGAADVGIVGKDVLMEQEPDVYEPLDLHYGRCRIVVAGPKVIENGAGPPSVKLKIATKYPKIAERYFNEKGLPVEIIRLSGAIELAPLVGLSDKIVDLITTGRTLRENNLVELAVITESSARLIVNRASLKTKTELISPLLNRLEKSLEKETE